MFFKIWVNITLVSYKLNLGKNVVINMLATVKKIVDIFADNGKVHDFQILKKFK
ncbi:hypothetical protein [Spiroplasma ixodetis]|uniref:hypothetical protein n=1 Tax=Spiroplasma ixodetis TaxID=2141 RepID=UPI00333EA0A5